MPKMPFSGKDHGQALLICGGNDLPGRAAINQRFVEAMKAAGHDHTTLQIVVGRNHSSIVSHVAEQDDEVASAMLKFIRTQCQKSQQAEQKQP